MNQFEYVYIDNTDSFELIHQMNHKLTFATEIQIKDPIHNVVSFYITNKNHIYHEYSVYLPALFLFPYHSSPAPLLFCIHDSVPFFSSFCNLNFASRSLHLLLLSTVKHLALIKALWLWVIELRLYSCIHAVTGGWKRRELAHFGKA